MAVQMQAPDGRIVAVDAPVLVVQLKAQGYTVVTTPEPPADVAPEPVPEQEPEPVAESLPPAPEPVAETPAELPEGQFHSYVATPEDGVVDPV